MKKLPQRTCIGCNEKKDKKELIRIVVNKENEIKVDKTGKQDGRGTYICNNINCLEKAMKAKNVTNLGPGFTCWLANFLVYKCSYDRSMAFKYAHAFTSIN